MLRSFTRLICLIVSFQLAVGCGNSSQVSVTAPGLGTESGFRVLGIVVKTLERINDMVFPSAMARVATGTVVLKNYTDRDNVFEIASQTLYDGGKEFDFSVPLAEVAGQVLLVEYVNTDKDDARAKFENTSAYIFSGEMNIILNSRESMKAALIKEEIDRLPTATATIVKDLVENFDATEVEGLLAKGKGSVDDIFTSLYLTDKVAVSLIELQNKEITSEEFARRLETYQAEAKTLDVTGGRVVCSDTVSFEATSKMSGTLTFYTTDAQTKDTFGASKEIAYPRSAEEGIAALAMFYADVKKTIEAKGFTAIGSFKFVDDVNKISSTCNFQVAPKGPEADSALFAKYSVAGFKNLDDAAVDLDKKYEETIVQFRKACELAKVDLKSSEGLALYTAQVVRIDGWYKDYYDEAVSYFK